MEEVVGEDLPLVHLGQVDQGTGWDERAVVLPPLWEGLYLRVEHDMGRPLRDFLQGLVSRLGNTPQELHPALMAWKKGNSGPWRRWGGTPQHGGWVESP